MATRKYISVKTRFSQKPVSFLYDTSFTLNLYLIKLRSYSAMEIGGEKDHGYRTGKKSRSSIL